MRNVVGNLSKPKDTACFHVFCEKLVKNLVILLCPGVSLPKKHVSPHFPLRKPHILRSEQTFKQYNNLKITVLLIIGYKR